MDGPGEDIASQGAWRLLAVRDNPEHAAAMKMHDIGAIDLVVVNLYPFAETVMKGASRDEIIENIDIAGRRWCVARQRTMPMSRLSLTLPITIT